MRLFQGTPSALQGAWHIEALRNVAEQHAGNSGKDNDLSHDAFASCERHCPAFPKQNVSFPAREAQAYGFPCPCVNMYKRCCSID